MKTIAAAPPVIGPRTGASLALRALPIAAPIAVGLAIGAGHGLEAVALVVVAAAITVGLVDWRYSLFGLLLYLPFSGIPIIAAYPDTTLAILAKDVLFVIPAYLGFLVQHGKARRRLAPDRALGFLLVLLAMLVLGQALNPQLPNRLVAAIGVKVWIFYVPMWVLGYHFIRQRSDLHRVLAVMSLAAVVPLVVGLVEAILIYSGRASLAYSWYGDAASVATQEFAELGFSDGGALRRIPSTFSFVTQYFAFTVSMVAITYAWWRASLAGTRWSFLGGSLWILAILGGVLSGARAAFFFIPLVVVLLVVFDRRGARLPIGQLVVISLALPLAVGMFGARLWGLFGDVLALGNEYLQVLFLQGLHNGLATTTMGLGTGIDTNASRYAFSDPAAFRAVGGVWYESWYVKSLLELGVAGLLLVGLIFAVLAIGALVQHHRLRDPKLRAVSAALLAVLIWSFVISTKGQYLDVDPTNVYFWLFAGMLAAIPRLDQGSDPMPEAADDGT
jgi:hypothetical protein